MLWENQPWTKKKDYWTVLVCYTLLSSTRFIRLHSATPNVVRFNDLYNGEGRTCIRNNCGYIQGLVVTLKLNFMLSKPFCKLIN